jgi:excisionase family DNA binding protein
MKGGGRMAAKQQAAKTIEPMPMLKTVEQMSRISGIGENKLRELMDKGEIEYVQNGNRRLLADSAIWDWYERNKIAVGMKQERPAN